MTKQGTWKVWVEVDKYGNHRIHSKEPMQYCDGCEMWEDENGESEQVLICSAAAERVFGDLAKQLKPKQLAEIDLRRGRVVEIWEPNEE